MRSEADAEQTASHLVYPEDDAPVGLSSLATQKPRHRQSTAFAGDDGLCDSNKDSPSTISVNKPSWADWEHGTVLVGRGGGVDRDDGNGRPDDTAATATPAKTEDEARGSRSRRNGNGSARNNGATPVDACDEGSCLGTDSVIKRTRRSAPRYDFDGCRQAAGTVNVVEVVGARVATNGATASSSLSCSQTEEEEEPAEGTVSKEAGSRRRGGTAAVAMTGGVARSPSNAGGDVEVREGDGEVVTAMGNAIPSRGLHSPVAAEFPLTQFSPTDSGHTTIDSHRPRAYPGFLTEGRASLAGDASAANPRRGQPHNSRGAVPSPPRIPGEVISPTPVSAAAGAEAPRWRKVLYERQPFEDNYVDPRQFLEGLRENENVRGYHYLDVVYNTLVIVQQVSLVALFTCAFGVILASEGENYSLVYLDGAILLMTWVMYVQFRKRSRKHFDDSELLVFHGDYAHSAATKAKGAGGSSSTSGGGGGSLGGAWASTSQQQLPSDLSRGRSPMVSPSGGFLPSPEDGATPVSVPYLSIHKNSTATPHALSKTANPLCNSPSPKERSPLHSNSHWAASTASSGTFSNTACLSTSAGTGGGGGNTITTNVANSSATSNDTASAFAAGSPSSAAGMLAGNGRPIVVKDGSEQTHRDVPWTVGYISDFARKVISLGSFIVFLTPVLSTLTVTYSTDTIIALSILTMAFHILLADYSYLNGYTDKYAPNFSVNAALFGVILIASRIPSPMESGSLIAFGAFCFSLSPIARHMVKQHSKKAHITLTAVLFVLTAFFLSSVPVLCFLYVLSMLMIAFVIPWWFMSLHSSVKYQINGPWDEAKPLNSAAAAEWATAGLLR